MRARVEKKLFCGKKGILRGKKVILRQKKVSATKIFFRIENGLLTTSLMWVKLRNRKVLPDGKQHSAMIMKIKNGKWCIFIWIEKKNQEEEKNTSLNVKYHIFPLNFIILSTVVFIRLFQEWLPPKRQNKQKSRSAWTKRNRKKEERIEEKCTKSARMS